MVGARPELALSLLPRHREEARGWRAGQEEVVRVGARLRAWGEG